MYATQAGVTDDATMHDGARRPVRQAEEVSPQPGPPSPYLSLYPTFTDPEHNSTFSTGSSKLRRSTTPPPLRQTCLIHKHRYAFHPSRDTENTAKKEKGRLTYSDKRKIELSAKGACFNCEQTGHMVKDYLKKNMKKDIEASGESEKDNS